MSYNSIPISHLIRNNDKKRRFKTSNKRMYTAIINAQYLLSSKIFKIQNHREIILHDFNQFAR
jgi:hypothetical protein